MNLNSLSFKFLTEDQLHCVGKIWTFDWVCDCLSGPQTSEINFSYDKEILNFNIGQVS